MPYVWLGLAGLILAGTVILPRRNGTALATFWVAGGIVFTADYLVLDLLEMYHYRPGLLAGQVPDIVFGVFLAELAFVGGFATWLVYTVPPWAGATFGTLLVVGLEVLFRRWGVFVGYSWSVWHSVVAFPPYFLLVYWFRAAAERRGIHDRWVCTLTRVNVALWWAHFAGMVVYWMMAGLVFQIHWLPTFARNQALGALLTVAPWMTAAMLWVMAAHSHERVPRLLYASAGLLLFGLVWEGVGLWHFRAPWNVYLHTAAQVATIYIAVRCDDWIGAWSPRAKRLL